MEEGLVWKKCLHGEISVLFGSYMTIAYYVVNCVVYDTRQFEKEIGAEYQAKIGSGEMTIKRVIYPFVDTVGERSYLTG